MKKIKEDKPCYGLSVKFASGVDFDEKDGRIISLHLKTRNTSVPLIVVAGDSEAKRNDGQDGIFALCSENCATKMKEIITKELELFSGESSMVRL
ncbi:hypothetical protein [Paenibacillus sp. yr247]|uniref:hypothetical protein n=1 Tax=Paenibacillus sp. yr247 TaxID=1761880 RepID=UPI0020C90A2E|nr:hypothetical protein [Paenibacillus sp. yr247]